MTVDHSAEVSLQGHLYHLDETQQATFEEFKVEVEAAVDHSRRKWYDDATLLRFLRARSWNVPKALKQFLECDEWRRSIDIENLYASFPVDEFMIAQKTLPRFTGRRDRMGRPLYVFRLGSLTSHIKDLSKLDEPTKYNRICVLVEVLNRLILPVANSVPNASSPTPISSVSTIVDLDGTALTTLWSLRGHLQQPTALTTAIAPETNYAMAVVNAPSFFPMVWSWVKGFFDEGTRNKLFVLGAKPGEGLMELVKPEDLPKVYGGELDWVYEDEPKVDDEIRKVIGGDWPKGPAIWEDGKIILLGTGRENTS